MVAAGQLPAEVRDTLVAQIDGAYTIEQVARDEANKNAGLAAMQLMLAAKAKGYDTVAMGGFDKARLVEALKIPARYIPVMMIPIGEHEPKLVQQDAFHLINWLSKNHSKQPITYTKPFSFF